MEEIELDAAATATLSHLANASAFGATGGRPPAAGFVDDLLGLVSGGYLLGRIVLGTTFVRARYSGTEIEAETNMVRLLGHVKLISNPEIEQLVAGAVQDAVDELAGPALRRRSSLRKAISASRAIDLVYDALDDGLKTALVEEALFDLLPSAQ